MKTIIPPKQPPRSLWCVMKAHKWSCLSVHSYTMSAPADGPEYFMPIFETREQAVKWENGNDEHVKEVRT